ncbi:hypothetical protein SprV_0301069300 [Sparganum proliferum]
MLITAPVCTALSTPLCSTRCVVLFGRSLAHLPALVAERRFPPGERASRALTVSSPRDSSVVCGIVGNRRTFTGVLWFSGQSNPPIDVTRPRCQEAELLDLTRLVDVWWRPLDTDGTGLLL